MSRRIAIVAVGFVLGMALLVTPAMAMTQDTGVALEAIVKLVPSDAGLAIEQLTVELEAESIEPVLATRDIYRVRSLKHMVQAAEDGTVELDRKARKWLEDRVGKHDQVTWAVLDSGLSVGDDRFHAWPNSLATTAPMDAIADQPAFAGLSLDESHALGNGTGVVIAVIDTGVDPDHPLLAERLVAGFDLIDGDTDATDEANWADDDGDGLIDEAYGHGTFIAGIIAQVAPGALIQPIRVLDADGRADLYMVIDAIDLAIEMDADVINMSFGLVGKHKSRAMDDALKRAQKAGIVVVAAAGNVGTSDHSYPASAKDVIAVTALGDDGQLLAPFSNHGKWVHVAAPGVNIVSAVPDGGYATWAGSSMATAVVSSLAALLAEYAPAKDGKAIRKAVLDGARKMKGKEKADKGIIDFLHSFEKIG